ncbi:hypothetical protein LTR78_000756 [Recurvomyces mirabilis]|uniref:EthD domain-containing protein n=1 Tax=Recurvomyces mirabilis TaxID=574656 RepID=A0AAE1C5P8_9PEZI|nr:hypothetical protein LTR78_000756 [Recurvomyces mirabilis]KAK5158726.1 hypothetical protein LTS14_002834 [Recurvomyces mirabilis]
MAGVDKPLPGKKPGILFANSKIKKPDQLSKEEYTRWYEQVHIPDIFKTSGIKEASRWTALDPSQDRPFLALYPLDDLDFLDTDEFKAIPVHDDNLPGSGEIFDLADFDTRYYKLAQLYEPENAKSGQPDFVIAAAFTPTDDKEYDAWYRQEHLKEVSGLTGWRKTERYDLTFARQNRSTGEDNKLPEPPKFLTLHYIDGESLPEKELAKAAESERTKKNLSEMKATQMAIFKKLAQFQK